MASGDTLCVFFANDNEPPDADYATLDTILVASADEPDDYIPVLDFDPGATNEHAEFGGFMPRHYGGGGITVTLIWSSDATSGAVKWNVALKSVTDDADDLDTKVYAAANTVTATTANAAGEADYAAITFTDGADMDSVAVGEYFRMRVTRDSADAADTLNSNDAELICVEIKET
jgi:hypothetical protein